MRKREKSAEAGNNKRAMISYDDLRTYLFVNIHKSAHRSGMGEVSISILRRL